MTLKDIEMRAAEIREAMTSEDADIEARCGWILYC